MGAALELDELKLELEDSDELDETKLDEELDTSLDETLDTSDALDTELDTELTLETELDTRDELELLLSLPLPQAASVDIIIASNRGFLIVLINMVGCLS